MFSIHMVDPIFILIAISGIVDHNCYHCFCHNVLLKYDVEEFRVDESH